jgi:hypothetical protein
MVSIAPTKLDITKLFNIDTSQLLITRKQLALLAKLKIAKHRKFSSLFFPLKSTKQAKSWTRHFNIRRRSASHPSGLRLATSARRIITKDVRPMRAWNIKMTLSFF